MAGVSQSRCFLEMSKLGLVIFWLFSIVVEKQQNGNLTIL